MQHLETEICRKLNKLPHVSHEDTDLKVAHITFTYDNEQILNLLVKRGKVITKGQFHELKKINDKIDHYFDHHYHELYRPIGAFVTFQTQEGLERALHHYPLDMEHHKIANPKFQDVVENEEHNFLGKELRLEQAKEPTDILWENRHVLHKTLVIRSIGAGICIFLVLIGALILFKALSNTTAIN